jgi:hypothetical protein
LNGQSRIARRRQLFPILSFLGDISMRSFSNRFAAVGVASLILSIVVLGSAKGQQPQSTAEESNVQSAAGQYPTATAPSNGVPYLSGGRLIEDDQSAPISQREGELETKIQEAVRQFANSTDETARVELRANISRLLEQQFELRQKRHEQTVQKLEERVRLLRAALQKRENARQKMVDGRLNVLLEEAEGLGWGDFNGAQPLSTQGQYGRQQSGRR